MLFQDRADARDLRVVDTLRDFVPSRVVDLHAHLFAAEHVPGPGPASYVPLGAPAGRSRYREAVLSWLPADELRSIFFGFPSRDGDRAVANAWVGNEVAGSCPAAGGRADGTQASAPAGHRRPADPSTADHPSTNAAPADGALALAGPSDDPVQVAEFLDATGFLGLKPYHYFVSDTPPGPIRRQDEPAVEAIAPEWMWRVCHERQGFMMLHIMRDGLADEGNVASLVRLATAYPGCTVVLAHAARGFSHRTVRAGIARIAPLENIWLDTSAVCGTATLAIVLSELGPHRLAYGSDFPISNLRGTNTAVGPSDFEWLYAAESTDDRFVLVGVESLLALREACGALGLPRSEVEDIFFRNAERRLSTPDHPRAGGNPFGPTTRR
jgi:glutamate-1-semialdehyde 2,1-aminomutase